MRFGSANQAVDLNRKSILLFIVAFKVHLTVHDCTSHKYAVDFHGYHCSTGQKFDIIIQILFSVSGKQLPLMHEKMIA